MGELEQDHNIQIKERKKKGGGTYAGRESPASISSSVGRQRARGSPARVRKSDAYSPISPVG